MIIGEATQHDEQVALAEELMDKEDYRGAAHEASKVLEDLEPTLPTIAQAALAKGRALMTHVLTEMSEKGELPPKQTFEDIWKAYQLSKKLNPDCDVTKEEMTKVSYLLKELPPPRPPKAVAKADCDVLIVGAGAAGIGMAVMLTQTFGLDRSRVLVLERGPSVGTSFRNWPKEMRFISPSFNQQGWTESFDLNAVVKGTSPAYSIHSEHPSGMEYARYLEAIGKTHRLNLQTSTEVVSIEENEASMVHSLFDVQTVVTGDNGVEKHQTVQARYIVWAAGEFQYPNGGKGAEAEKAQGVEETKEDTAATTTDTNKSENDNDDRLIGSEHCLHNSQVRSWADLEGEDFLLIGGYESGVDAAVNLAKAGKHCHILASTPCWSVKTEDPSSELAPYTAARLREVLSEHTTYPKPKLYAPIRALRVNKISDQNGGGYDVITQWKASVDRPHAPLRDLVQDTPMEPQGSEGTTLTLHTKHPPILCTGFEGSVKARASHLFEFASNKKNNKEEDANEEFELQGNGHHHHNHPKKGCLEGAPLLTEHDESTLCPGVFLVGPQVSHGTLSFCFVYKFRQRFGIVADAICRGLGMDTRAAVAECRKANMYLDDFSCCGDTCGDVC